MERYEFVTTCVDSTADRINEMVELASDMTNHQFIYHVAPECGIADTVLESLGFAQWGQDANKSARALFAEDWAMSCHASWYMGFPCLYVRHSAIEHVYVPSKHRPALEKLISQERKRSSVKDDLEERWDMLEASAKVLGVSMTVAAKRFAEGNARHMLKYRIPFASFACASNAKTESFIKRWDQRQLQ